MKVNWECLFEPPVQTIFNSCLKCSFSAVQGEVGDIFKVSIGNEALRSCLKVLVAHKKLTVVMKAIKLKKETFRTLQYPRTPEASHGHRVTRRAATSGRRTFGWSLAGSYKLFGDSEKGKQTCPRIFLFMCWELLTQTEEHFNDFLYLSTISTFEEAVC